MPTHAFTWLFAFAVGFAGVRAHAATRNAGSCGRNDVQAAVDSAQAGDTVVIPAGSCTWTQGVTVDGKAIHVRGAAAGSVTIVNGAGGNLFAITEATVGHIELSLLAFVGGGGASHTVLVQGRDGGRAVLIHDNSWTGGIDAIRMETNRGVIWGNSMDAGKADRSFVQCKNGPDSSWSTASTMGDDDLTGESNVYVEDNVLTEVPLQALDVDDNCRIVVRHNVFDNSAMTSHGADTSPTGGRHWELYDNVFIFTNRGDCDGSQTVNLPYSFYIRGGTGVIADNVLPNMQSCAWGDKPEIVMTVQNLRRAGGPYGCWDGGWPAPHQVGQGHDGTTTVSDPAYIWGNTGGGNYASPARVDYGPDACGGGPSVTDYIQAGRDYIVGAPKPGYAKFSYPHPLSTGGVVPPPPPPPGAPAAPRGLRFVP